MRRHGISTPASDGFSEDTYEGDINNPQTLNLYMYVQNNPLIYVDPTGHVPTVAEAAEIAKHVYFKNYDAAKKDKLLGGWHLVNQYQVSTLRIGRYERKKAGGSTEIVLANQGTNSGWDWEDNLLQPVGLSNDMERSIDYAVSFVNDHPGTEITFVGHSKGGAEATANAVATNKNAVVFNPAVVNLKAYGLNSKTYTHLIAIYIVKGEILNQIEGTPSIGEVVYLRRQYSVYTWNPIKNTNNSIKNHSMDAVIEAIKELR